MFINRVIAGAFCCLVLVLLMAGSSYGQAARTIDPYFGIDWQGPTFGTPDPAGTMIWASEILLPAPGFPMPGPLPPPRVFWPGGPPGAGLGIMTWSMPAEVDALSYGNDAPNGCLCGFWHLSVDEFAMGMPGIPPPSVWSEGINGNREASADIFSGIAALMHPAMGPYPPGLILPNLDIIDGNGLPPTGVLGSGLGLKEPNPPLPGSPRDPGDNLDALEMDPLVQTPVQPVAFFSLDSRFVDPVEGPGANTGSAVANGFVGGDVLKSVWGGPPVLYAAAVALGLDRVAGAGPDSDDLDALILEDWGDGRYIAGQDIIAFSVRRGSAVIGAPDSRYGAPISEADILEPPIAGGVSPFPAILVPGEAVGLTTRHGGPQGQYGWDDLDALDVTRLKGDTDGDGDDDIFDVITVIVAFGTVPGAPGWDPFADLDCSKLVDIFDVIDAVQNFGATW